MKRLFMSKITTIKVPSLGESVLEATITKWYKKNGDFVKIDELLLELETEKVTLEVFSPASGILKNTSLPEGSLVKVGDELGSIEESAIIKSKSLPVEENMQITKKVTKADIIKQIKIPSIDIPLQRDRQEQRITIPRLRQKIAERLKFAQNTAAILTTFNEVNMTAINDLKQKYKDAFLQKHGVKLGYMSFFVKASAYALKQMPIINSCIEGNEIVSKNYYDIGVAVSTVKGLVVPVIKNADQLDLASIEKSVASFSEKAKNNKLTIDEMIGGNFTISNGGIFGSLLSTPILNPPQSSILGMHKIQERPVAENGQVIIRPMMYIALSYDHRLIDGREAVTFLVLIKECLEMPGRYLLDL